MVELVNAADSKSAGRKALRVQVPLPANNIMKQRTISETVRFTGQGIHSGEKVSLSLWPMPADRGIVFERIDGSVIYMIPLDLKNVGNFSRCTGLRLKKIEIQTIEHLLAAFYMTGLTNIRVQIDNPEVPVMDGSSYTFVRGIRRVGTVEQRPDARILSCSRTFVVRQNDSFITYTPFNGVAVTCVADFPHPDLENRAYHIDLLKQDAIKEISKARTFGFQAEIDELWAKGLGLGGNLNNTVILTDKGYMNKKLLYPDEPVRHKVLDFLGDMFISTSFFRGHIHLHKTGHKIHHKFLKAFLAKAKKAS